MKIKTNHFISLRETEMKIRSNGRKYTIRKTRGRIFFPDEYMSFFDCLKKKQKITFTTLINTGARINECRNIRVSDIDLERQNIVLRITKRMVNRPGAKVGIRKIRVISISSKFTKYLKNLIKDYKLESDDYIPILSTPAANIGMKKALVKAGIKDFDMFSLHTARKSLETWLLALDIDSFKVIKHFGHSSAVALKHYLGADIFNYEDKQQMRDIIGDLYLQRERR